MSTLDPDTTTVEVEIPAAGRTNQGSVTIEQVVSVGPGMGGNRRPGVYAHLAEASQEEVERHWEARDQ